MKLLSNHEIRKAVGQYDLTESCPDTPVAFSDDFERKMRRLTQSRRRADRFGTIARAAAVLAIIALTVPAFAWFWSWASPTPEEVPVGPLASVEGRENPDTTAVPDTAETSEYPPLTEVGPDGTITVHPYYCDSWEKAAEIAPFTLKVPTIAPKSFQNLKVYLFNTTEANVSVEYGERFESPEGEVSYTDHVFFTQRRDPDEPPFHEAEWHTTEPAMVGEAEGAYVVSKILGEENGLHLCWQVGDIYYALYSDQLTREELMEMALSLE